jgi:hypothetical protein
VTAPPKPGRLPGLGGGAEALFSDCGCYRYLLARSWHPDRGRLYWVMLNPSTGDADRMDPTLWRVFGLSQTFGAGSFAVVNLYPYITPDPGELKRSRPSAEAVAQNAVYLRSVLESPRLAQAARVVCAWGNVGQGTEEATRFLELAALAQVPLWCLGVTGQGAPRHPLHAPAYSRLQPYPPGAQVPAVPGR